MALQDQVNPRRAQQFELLTYVTYVTQISFMKNCNAKEAPHPKPQKKTQKNRVRVTIGCLNSHI